MRSPWGAYVPLLSSLFLCNKVKKKRWAEIKFDPSRTDGWCFNVLAGELDPETQAILKSGTVGRKGGICSITQSPIPLSYIRSEGRANRLRSRLICVVADGPKGRVYLTPTLLDEEAANVTVPELCRYPEDCAPTPALTLESPAQ